MTIKIDALELENVKRVKAIKLEPAENGLTVIGGRNGQGKTSILDAIAWTLGGDRKRPSDAKRDGSATDPKLYGKLTNGGVVERSGKNSTLKVTDPEGKRAGQKLLDSFIEELALDLPKFIAQSDAEKARTLLGILGVSDTLERLDLAEKAIYNKRTTVGQIRDQKRGVVEELPFWPDAPQEPVSAAELIEQQQEILAKNGENQRLREKVGTLTTKRDALATEIIALNDRIRDLEKQRDEKVEDQRDIMQQLDIATTSAANLHDESTTKIERSLADIDIINDKVRDNAMRAAAQKEVDALADEYRELTDEIEKIRASKRELLQGAKLPLDGLSIEDGALVYNGQRWDCMSGSDQLKVATAVVRKLKPECGFVLVDKMEQMDATTMRQFGEWAESQGLQIIATRVTDGDYCTIVIEDGYTADAVPAEQTHTTSAPVPSEATTSATKTWTAGEF